MADRYNLDKLKSALESQLSHHLDINTLFQFLFYAEAYNCNFLLRKCVTFVESNTHSVLSSKMILNLPFSHFKSFISRDGLLADEIDVFNTVQNWIVKNNPGPKEKKKLLKCVRLSEITPSELCEKVAPCGLFDQPAIAKAIECADEAKPRGKISTIIWSAYFMYVHLNGPLSSVTCSFI